MATGSDGPQIPQASNPFQPTSPTAGGTSQLEVVVDLLSRAVLQSADQTRQMSATLDILSRRNTNESGMWSRLIAKPDVFKPKDREEELSQFTEWSWQFKQYVRVISPNMFALLETVESDLEVENDHSIMSDEDVEMSKQLYALLASLLRERPVQILKAITDGNGCEVWRTLVRTLAPSSKARSLALLGAISQFPMMTNSNYHEQILKLEELCRKYEQSSSKTVDAELKAAILLRSLPASLRTHVSVNCSESATYDQLREVILRYERATQKWTTQLVSGPSTSATDTSAPMEIDQVWNAKGKRPKGKGKGGDGWRQPHHPKGGKDPKGKGKHYNQDYMKGKFGKLKGSPKGGKDGKGKSKGFQNDYGKGKGKGKTSVPYNNCKICGKPGHWSNECWMKKVNQVNNPGSGSQSATPPSSSHAGTPSVSSQSTTTATVKRVFNLADESDAFQFPFEVVEEGDEEDWGSWDSWWCYHVSAVECEHYDISSDADLLDAETGELVENFDLSVSDAFPGDEEWVKDHVQMVQQDPGPAEGWKPEGSRVEIVLDSGADVSVMPEQWLQLELGHAVPTGHVLMRDAQGQVMPNLGTRMVSLDLGPACIQERFHASSVGTPLLSLGRLLRKGWSLSHRNNTLCLCFEDVSVPVSFRRNSLVVEATVHNVEASEMSPIPDCTDEPGVPDEVRPLLEGRRAYVKFDFDPQALSASEAAERDPQGRRWTFLPTGAPACLSQGMNFVDPSSMMNLELWKYRTTAVKIAGKWELLELHQNVSASVVSSGALESLGAALPGVMYESVILTVMHRKIVEPEQFGFHVEMEAPNPLLDVPQPQVDGGLQADEGMPDDTNLDAEDVQPEARPVVPGVQLEREIPDEVEVEGKRLSPESSSAELKLACKALGIGATGSKTVLYKRLVKHIWRRKMEDDLALFEAAKLPERDPRPATVPPEPSAEEVANHNLSHVPYKPWCPICVSTRGRKDVHQQGSEAHRGDGGWPVLSMDLMYSSVEGSELEFMRSIPSGADKEKKILVLVCVDRDTGMLHAVPLPAKDTQAIHHAAKEVLGFLSYLGRTEVEIRGDNEPPMVALCDKVVNARNKAGLATRKAPSQPYEHQTNGAAEQAVLGLRDIGSTLLQQVKQHGFELHVNPELIPWAYVHAATLHNCYAVSAGNTPYERAFQVKYNGRLAMWGETVLFSLAEPHRKKGRPKFAKGVFLGKTMLNDLNICGTALGVYLSPTVKRLPESQQWDRVMLKEVQGKPWRYGLATMGLKLVPGLRDRKPRPEPMVGLPIPIHPLPPPDGGGAGDEAASDPPTEDARSDALSSDSGSEKPGGDPRGSKRERETSEPAMDEDSSKTFSPVPDETTLQEFVESRGEKREGPQLALAEDQPAKKVRSVKVGDTEYFVADEEMEDWWQGVEFDAQYYDDDWLDFSPVDDPEVMWESQGEADGPPTVGGEQLEKIEAESRQRELSRLLEMGVLEAMDLEPPEEKTLKCRYVYDWRFRQQQWVRRARLVCKQLKIWSPYRQDTYAPSTCPSMLRLLPHMFVSTPNWILRSFDVSDAFLMVRQRDELYIRLDDVVYRVWKCLPGQQMAPVYWHDELSGDLKECGLVGNAACPVVYGGENQAATVHVDDGLLGGHESCVAKTVETLKAKYKLECSPPLKNVGDQLRFLKRTLEVVPEGLKINVDPKYIEKVIKILGIVNPRHRKVPASTDLTGADDTEKLDELWSGRFRAALGCLLYLAPDRPDAQFTIGVLARGMSSPTSKQLRHVKYLAEYLYHTRDYSLILRWSHPGRSFLDETPRLKPRLDDEEFGPRFRLLEAVSDADWAGSYDRKSVTSGHIFLDGNLMYSYSRRQASISLSSCESELIASTSAIAEALFLKNILASLTADEVRLTARLDSSSARALLAKAGVSRVRHLDTRLLWTQSLVKEKTVDVKPVSTLLNTSDVGTKALTSDRVKYLLHLLGMYNHDGLIEPTKFPKRPGQCHRTLEASEVLRIITATLALSQPAAACTTMSAGGHHASLLEFGKEIFVQHYQTATFFVMSMVMIAMVVVMAPKWQKRRWGRHQEAEETGENQNTVRDRIHAWFTYQLGDELLQGGQGQQGEQDRPAVPERQGGQVGKGGQGYPVQRHQAASSSTGTQDVSMEPPRQQEYEDFVEPSWLVCSRPNSDDDEAGAAEWYTQSYTADGEDVEQGRGAQGNSNNQLPVVPGRFYMIGDPHKRKAYHTYECGMIQKWVRDLPSNVREITKQYADEKKLKPCKQCRP